MDRDTPLAVGFILFRALFSDKFYFRKMSFQQVTSNWSESFVSDLEECPSLLIRPAIFSG